MQVGVLGVGRMGSRHAELLLSVPGVSGVLVADADETRARAVADRLAVEVRPTDALLDEVDAVVIAAGGDHHPAAVRAAIERGRPTLCEKPLAGDLPSTIAVVGDVERSGVPVQIGFQRRFDRAYAEARRRLEAGELGDVLMVRLAAFDPPSNQVGAITDTVGLFRESSIHDFDLARWLTGSDVVEVHSVGALRDGRPVRTEDPEVAAVTLRTASGTICSLNGMLLNPRGYDIRTEVFGTRDSIVVGQSRRTPQRNLEPGAPSPAGDEWTSYLDRFGDAYARELRTFVDVARRRRRPSPGVRDALEAMRIAVAATRSLREGRTVRLDEIASADHPAPEAALGVAR